MGCNGCMRGIILKEETLFMKEWPELLPAKDVELLLCTKEALRKNEAKMH